MNKLDTQRAPLQLVKAGAVSRYAANLRAMRSQVLATYPLSTPRLEMRPWRSDDEEAYARTFGVSSPVGADAMAAAAQMREDMVFFAQYGFGRLALVDKTSSDRPVIGRAGFKPTNPRVFARTILEIGWHVIPEYQGCGLATEAAEALVAQGRMLGLGLVGVYFPSDNKKSLSVAAKIGALPIGEVEATSGPMECWAFDCGLEPTLPSEASSERVVGRVLVSTM